MRMKQFRTRLSIAFGEDDDAHLRIVKAYYGISSSSAAVRRAVAEHAKQIKQEEAKACSLQQDGAH